MPGKISTKLGTWNVSNGKPNYLEPVNDVISTTFLNNVNAVKSVEQIENIFSEPPSGSTVHTEL